MSQAGFAATIGATQPTVRAWERGEGLPQLRLFLRLAEVYGTDEALRLIAESSRSFDKPLHRDNAPAGSVHVPAGEKGGFPRAGQRFSGGTVKSHGTFAGRATETGGVQSGGGGFGR